MNEVPTWDSEAGWGFVNNLIFFNNLNPYKPHDRLWHANNYLHILRPMSEQADNRIFSECFVK